MELRGKGMGGEENMDSHPFVKSAYYPGKLLHASDFIREQEYWNRKLEFIMRKFQGWGIIDGLEVRTNRDGSLLISQGSAIDPCGRILVVPKDMQAEVHEIEGFRPEMEQGFILGLQYAERTVETEPVLLEKDKLRQPAKIEEGTVLRAFGEAEYRSLTEKTVERENVLTEEKVLYESDTVILTVQVPRVVPSDSVFRFRICARAAGENGVHIGWRGVVKLQGAFLAQSAATFFVLEEKSVLCTGSLQREWGICTEENRLLPVLLEISRLEVVTEYGGTAEVPTCQLYVETSQAYEQTVKKYLQNQRKQNVQGDWVPLARMRAEKGAGQGQYIFSRWKAGGGKENDVRVFVSRPAEEDILRRIGEENGILDIRWRRMWKYGGNPPSEPSESGRPSAVSPPEEEVITERKLRELMEADRKSRIRRGIVIIAVPNRYRKGQVLYSEEVSHGFPGEEVLVWCGRVREEESYAYWERDRKQYRVFGGDEGLFSGRQDGWEIRRQAVAQDVEAGTFRIAVTLAGRGRRSAGREVAVSWTAVRIG